MHPTEADLILLLEEKGTEALASRIRSHLAECPACSEQIAFLMRLPKVLSDETAPEVDSQSLQKAREIVSKRSFPWLSSWVAVRPVRFAVAILLLAAVGVSIPLLYETSRPSRYRTGSEPAPALSLSPEDGTTVDESPVALRWTRVPHAAGYRLMVYRENGTLLWNGGTTDTSFVVPVTVEFERGKSYFWTVEALLPDQTAHRSKLHAFRYASP